MARAKASPLPMTVVLLGLTSLFTDVGTEMIFPLLPVFLVEQLRAGPAYLGLVEGAADTVASLLKLASGVIADATSRRKPLVFAGYLLASAARPFVAIATHPWHVLAVRLTDRVGKGIRGAPRDALIADAAGERAGRAFGFHQAMDNVGAVVGPLIATGLVALGWSVRRVFWLAVVPGVLATIAVACVREPQEARPATPHPATPHPATPHPATPHPATSHPGPPHPAAHASTDAPAPPAALDRPFYAYLAILGIFSLANSSDAFLLLRAREVGLSTAAIPVLWASFNASQVVWAFVGGEWADRVSPVRLIAGGWGVFAVVYLGLAGASAPWHVWVLFVVYGIFYGLTQPVEKALVKAIVSDRVRGRAYGAYNFVLGIAALPAGLLTGAIWRIAGPPVALGASAGLALLASAMLLAWDGRRARRRQAMQPRPLP